MAIDLTRHELTKARLKIAKSSMSEVAREIGVTHSSVTVVSQGYRRSARIEAAIAGKLGVPVEELYPERYPSEKT
ncbi:helix-turn-helix domain-containing protein [Ruegeria sp. YS9]|jgi:lambda repressor-like predicted transcriptional regulator|uniref:helix-turn-helix domain-containing protein n=1 Tax=Ruegeria sp. YS9 TaxID=2966453 RepID=UPI00214CA113|nr:helix-turn-helix domain-containing protein [Ruegeria sp. YS9]UUV05526.1 helix-turn-helix domain-containing protein [Ruegeria sp. YS9]